MILTNEERLRFAEYLERDAESSRLLIEQMVKQGLPDFMQQRLKIERAAATVIAQKLRNCESQKL